MSKLVSGRINAFDSVTIIHAFVIIVKVRTRRYQL